MHTKHRITHRTSGTLAALTLALALTACGGDDSTGAASTSSSDHNDTDVAFASDMIQHHAQALTMVDLTVERDLDPALQQVAEGIRDAQGPEIETMSNWLEQWGEEVPPTVRDHSNAEGHDMGDMADDTGMDMPGMMSDEDLEELADAPDADFEDLWLEMMIEHHEGAVSMAETEQEDGEHEPAVSLAEEIVATQTEEIATMQGLLDS
ncbi:lipoprotein [Nocardioides psychrotolerans]|uniref:Uncharacterized conserved protein, DUF305 family n=1 Tax=Nocardioides psychrotolerans TaxID=1005945 RepID=A0A1I3E1G5_9ACTN|nr:DUF305 domain-containing protein [Nocardioides psychrotolerans]GEP37555.1 lipoprotein [Nocardioides psychrotolerans]SFH92678.1 Uncharacterized conserved protein, DUF305 family [Nocardioides psychrotolerans]